MNSDVVIHAAGIGKKYTIGHETERERYIALRDVVGRAARTYWRKARDMTRGGALIAGDEREDFWALKDISFEVERGEVLGIIGRNGAGKSTLLKVLSRITEPTEGRVELKGRIASLLEVGTGFHPELTGRENIYLNGAILGMTRAEIRRRFDEIVDFAGVDKFLDTPVKRYSSGMYVRLAFAVAAHLESEILIVDEVLAVGDAEFQKKCLGKMQDVAGHGRTVLFVSHNTRSIVQLCSRCLLLNTGQLTASMRPSEAVRRYLTEGTKAHGFVDLVTEPPASERGSKDIAFRSFEIINSDGATASRIGFGEPLTVRITLEALDATNDLVVGFSFVSADGREIQGTTAHDGGIVPRFGVGLHALDCRVSPMVLVPGRYFIRAAIFSQGHVYHHVDEVLQFEVDPGPYRAALAPASHFVGDVYLRYEWSMLPVVRRSTDVEFAASN